MVFEFQSKGEIGMMEAFAKSIGTTADGGLIHLPENFGKGYLKGFVLSPDLRIMLHQYEIKEDLTFKRGPAGHEKSHVILTFHNLVRHSTTSKRNSGVLKLLPAVQLASNEAPLETFFPARTEINSIVIYIKIDLLKSMIQAQAGHALLASIISVNQPFIYEEVISTEIQDVATKIFQADVPEELGLFHLKIRTEELIYLFFAELLKRKNIPNYPLNAVDLKLIYQIRDTLISDLSSPPILEELTHFSGMSGSKMNRLFKQIFGHSIYNYYQIFRMNEAAYLIKTQKKSVSEAAYQLGFSNLSHFTRLFERYIGLKPKKYSLGSKNK